MGTPYLSELRLISFNFAPKGWTMANGQFLPINQNQALFALLGTTFGGNGQTTFALPDLRGRAPIHQGNGFTLGQAAGATSHTLNLSQLPAHTHPLQGIAATSNSNVPGGHMLANTSGNLAPYGPANNLVNTFAAEISNVGGGQPHQNQSPYLVMNWIIALQGIFPSQN